MITFVVNNHNNILVKYTEPELKIIDIKSDIIKQLQIKSKYIDIEFIIDKPLRSMGKFNIEAGILPRTLDRYTIDRFAFFGKDININIKYHVVDDYTLTINNNNKTGTYIPPNKKLNDKIYFNIKSNKDFPPL